MPVYKPVLDHKHKVGISIPSTHQESSHSTPQSAVFAVSVVLDANRLLFPGEPADLETGQALKLWDSFYSRVQPWKGKAFSPESPYHNKVGEFPIQT